MPISVPSKITNTLVNGGGEPTEHVIPEYTISVRVTDRGAVIKLLDHVCEDHTIWSWDKPIGKEVRPEWYSGSKRAITFTGEKCKAAASHFKLVYEEPKEPRVTFLGGIGTPFTYGVGKSSLSILAANRALGKSAISAQIFKDTFESSCIVCDHENVVSLKSIPLDARRQLVENLIGIQGGTLPTPFEKAIAASGSSDPESK